MPWVGGVVAGVGAIGGGLLGASAADKAAKAQQGGQQQSLDWIKNVYGNTGANLQPFIGAGQSALGSLLNFYGLPGGTPGKAGGAAAGFSQFQNTPFYQFPLQQANLATSRALASSGLTGSPGAIGRDIGQLNAGYASSGLGQYLAGLQGLSGSGQNAAGQLGSIGVGTGAQIGAAYTNMGNAGAQGIMNSASSINQGINNASPFITGQGSSSYGGGTGGLIGALKNAFSGSGGGGAEGFNNTVPATGQGYFSDPNAAGNWGGFA